MRFSLQKSVAAWLGVATIIVLIVATGTWRSIRHLVDANGWVTHTHEVIETLEGVQLALTDAETAQRTFLLTGDAGVLKLYVAGGHLAGERVQAARKLTKDNPAQQKRLDALEPLVQRRLALMREPILLQRQGQNAAAMQQVKSGQDARVMNQVRAVITQMQGVENTLLAQRTRQAEAGLRRILISIVGGVLLNGGILVLVYLLIRGEMSRRQRAEALLSGLASIVESSGDAIIGQSLDGTISTWNEGATRLFGYESAEVVGQSSDLLLPKDSRLPFVRDAERKLREKVGQGESLEPLEAIRAAKDGRQIHVSLALSPTRDAWGRITGLATIARDITESKQAVQLVWESEKRFAAFMRYVPGVAYMKDRQGRYAYINQTFQDAFSLKLEEVIGKTDTDLWPDAAPEFQEHDRQVMATGEPLLINETMTGKNGAQCWFSSKFPIMDDWGTPVLLGGVSVDVTERQRAEAALRESEERLRLALHAGGMGTWDLDLVSHAVRLSPSLQALMGMEVETTHAPLDDFLQCVHPDDRTLLTGTMQEYIQTGEDPQPEFRVVWPNGDVHWMSGRSQIVRDESGRPVRMVGVAIDVTRRKSMELALRESEARARTFALELEDTNRQLQDFAYIASHDLQEPLRKIQTFGGLLREAMGTALDESAGLYLGRIENAAERMQILIRDLLAYSRVTTVAGEAQPVDLNKIANEVLSDLEGRIEQSGGKVVLGGLPVVRADATQMRQVLQNLMGNALKFVRPGIPPVVQVSGRRLMEDELDNGEVADEGSGADALVPLERSEAQRLQEGVSPAPDRDPTKTSKPSTWCRIEVCDNGIGFDEKYVDRIFAPFQRLHGRNEYEGTGMGLSIVRKIAERNGGSITAHSAPGEGATFRVTLPVAVDEE